MCFIVQEGLMKKTYTYLMSIVSILTSTMAVAEWNGEWVTTKWNEMSVCGSTKGPSIPAGPIWDNEDAKRKCPEAVRVGEQKADSNATNGICRNYANGVTKDEAGNITAGPTSPCKRGVAFPKPTSGDLQALKNVYWWYGWAPAPEIPASSPNMEFVPMLWGEKQFGLETAIPSGSHTLLGFNEPNFFVQANLSAEDAAAKWPKLEALAKSKNMKLASPAMNYCGGGCWDTDPFVYLDKFVAACKGCQIDYIAVHWYNCDVASLKDYIGKFKRFNKPIWLTEFACLQGDTSVANQKRYMKEAVDYLEHEPAVVKYAWFAGRSPELPTSNLLASDGQLTELGQQYISLPVGEACNQK